MKVQPRGEFTNECAFVECAADPDDALSVEYDEEAGFRFELLGSKDPVFLRSNHAVELARWILRKADAD